MSFSSLICAVSLLWLIFGTVACSSGGGTQDSVVPARPGSSSSSSGSASSSGATVSCAYQETPFSPSTSPTAQVRLELERYDTCSAENADVFAFESGGYWVGDTQGGELLSHTISLPKAGYYELTLRVLPPFPLREDAAQLALAATGRDLPPVEVDISAQSSSSWRDLVLPLTYFSEGLQHLQLKIAAGGVGLDYLDWRYAEESQSAAEIVSAMGIGINLGNTFDAPQEGEWAPAAERHFLEDFAEAGFGHVRFPVTWDKHVSTTPPYTIDAVFLERVEQAVDWALAQGLYVILNAHHEAWLKEDYENPAARTRFAAIWRQVATHMQQKPARLIFEILNEPVGMTAAQVDQLNSSTLALIRESNPTRLVVFSGNGFTPVASLLAASVPSDQYLIGNFHSYDPWPFAGQCTRSWGSPEDLAQLTAIYQQAADWSVRTGIPVMVNEFGAAHYDYQMPQNVCNVQARLEYLAAHVALAKDKGLAATVWDDDGSFQIYRRQDRTWRAEKDVLVGSP